MNALQAALLGTIQGLGEFLPISSSAHLIVVPWLLGWPDHGLAFDVALHLGTLLAVLVAFAQDWARIFGATWRDLRAGQPFASAESQLLAILAVSSVPAALSGLLLDHLAEGPLRSPPLIAVNMVLLGAVLLIADRRARNARSGWVKPTDAFLIGCAQALAVVPGVSRAGATITAALLLGYRREEAARFSFLLATPVVLGAALLKVPGLVSSPSSFAAAAAVGCLVSAVVGLLSIRFLLAHVRTRDYRPFVYYRWAFAAVVAVALWLRGSVVP